MHDFQRFPEKAKRTLPKPRPMTAREKRDNHDYSWRLHKELCSRGMRFLYARDRTAVGLSQDAQEALEDFLMATLAADTKVPVYDDRDPGAKQEGKRDQMALSRVVGKVVEWCAENFDGPTTEARARKGGQSGTRRKVRPVDLVPLEGLSRQQQAERLGVATSTISNLRRELAELQRAQREEASRFDHLLEPACTSNRIVPVQVTNGSGCTSNYSSPREEREQSFDASKMVTDQELDSWLSLADEDKAPKPHDHELTQKPKPEPAHFSTEEVRALMADFFGR